MKNFQSDGFKRGASKFGGPKSFQSDRRPAGRYETGRPARSERDDSKPELFKTTCTTCSKPCEVPFRPDGIKPVLCRDCFATKNSAGFTPAVRPNDRNQGTTSFRQDTPKRPAPRMEDYTPFQPSRDANYKELKQQIGVLESKINRIVDLLTPEKASTKVAKPLSLDVDTDSISVPAEKKERKPKLATPAVKKAAAKKKVAKKASLAKKSAKATE